VLLPAPLAHICGASTILKPGSEPIQRYLESLKSLLLDIEKFQCVYGLQSSRKATNYTRQQGAVIVSMNSVIVFRTVERGKKYLRNYIQGRRDLAPFNRNSFQESSEKHALGHLLLNSLIPSLLLRFALYLSNLPLPITQTPQKL
jgi:hypothetical protein